MAKMAPICGRMAVVMSTPPAMYESAPMRAPYIMVARPYAVSPMVNESKASLPMVDVQKTMLGKKNKSAAAFFVSAPGKAVRNAFQKKKTPQNATDEKITTAPLMVGPVTTKSMPVMMCSN